MIHQSYISFANSGKRTLMQVDYEGYESCMDETHISDKFILEVFCFYTKLYREGRIQQKKI